MIYAITVGILIAGAVYLIMQRGMVRIIFGMSLFGHASNLTLLAAGNGAWRGEAFPSQTSMDQMADPLPQAFVLTAIVIAMATTTILLLLAALGRDDDTIANILDADQAAKLDPDALTTMGRTAHKGVRG
ncbi:cation:proton antiporter subunit C [Corynebacterium sp. MSK044]|uniref:cation:proton antiporter subunit C n=1 Tax=unclassified Corynebacterium TaxID=2624378 RepID=UPI00254BB045|nr:MULTISPECIES: cation:proton antiporter subunit C [unclassified Corynebacterium]MDK8795493.1 cation:proton antiporter subunit C [Corynebacterium sp. MSK041]MDK8798313.1 cation:proton antiporter subunit C [Corynebacterium sp. MSK044]